MAIQLGAEPENDFTTPLGLLSDCHRRIEKFLSQLIGLVSEAQTTVNEPVRQKAERDAGLTAGQKSTLEVALRYFREAAPRHTQDEEESLFPRMRACSDEAVPIALASLNALEADHDQAEAAHAEVEALGQNWLSNGHLSARDLDRLGAILRDLRSLYQRHILVEDTQIFPLAERVLDADAIRAIGEEMALRRGIDLSKIADLNLYHPGRRPLQMKTK